MSVRGAVRRVAAAMLVVAAQGCVTVAHHVTTVTTVTTTNPLGHLVLLRDEALAESRRRLLAGDTTLKPALDALLDDARAALAAAPVAVTQKRRVPPSGDRHDYMSMAPYWWPDSTKPGGLPFVRHDGLVYPGSRVDHDGTRFGHMVERVESLALAHYFTGDARYAERAATLVRVFFLDSATRMNPSLRYAQAVSGVNDGRGTGILDTHEMPRLLDAIRLIEDSPAWTAEDRAGMTTWTRDYLRWLLESANGRDEAAAPNNHGTFYDEQVLALALFTGDSAVARRIAADGRTRIATEITADGRQPLELERTRPEHYSLYNLEAFTMLAEMARRVDVDLWHYQAPSGGSIAAAIRFVAPYADATRAWPAPQVSAPGAGDFLRPMRRAAAATGDPVAIAALARLPERLRAIDRSALEYPAPRQMAAADDSLLDAAFTRAAAQLRRSATALDPAKGYPRITDAAGRWVQRPLPQWTSGFFAGTLWYMYQATRDSAWSSLARRWTTGLEPAKRITTTHDVGFIVFDSFGHAYLLERQPADSGVVIEAAHSLSTRYSPVVSAIKSWDTERGTDARKSWRYPVIIDNLMNLELLFWAGTHGGDTSWARMAERHALTSARAHVRPDGSVAHVALFDPATGALERTVTWQGYADTSAWARGQAWAIHGFTTAYRYSRRPELLAAAQRSADWLLAHLPADGVPYWDLRHPAIPAVERDASAAAIAASGLYDLARESDAGRAATYRAAADHMLTSLARDYMAPATADGAILAHSVGGRPQGVEIDVGIVYADYYFVEALLRRRGEFLDGR